MAGPSSAGPSTPRSKKNQKKRALDAGGPDRAPKTARLEEIGDGSDGDVEMSGGGEPSDPMAALEAAEQAGEGVHDGPVEEAEGLVPGRAPVRADEFEQEAEREVDATKTLGGGGDEGKMKLVHQVRHQVGLKPS